MQFDDIRKLATGNVLFNLKRIIAPRLVTILYLLGLAAIGLWAVAHFFSTFRFGFGSGLWGLLEIIVFGLLALIVLRIGCEAVIVYFRAHVDEADDYTPADTNTSLIDEVREAIEELAEEEPDAAAAMAPSPVAPSPARARDADIGTPVAEEPAVMPDADTPQPAPTPAEPKSPPQG